MGQVYNITSDRESKVGEHCAFNTQREKIAIEESSTYMGVLKIFREVFGVIDITHIIKKPSRY